MSDEKTKEVKDEELDKVSGGTHADAGHIKEEDRGHMHEEGAGGHRNVFGGIDKSK